MRRSGRGHGDFGQLFSFACIRVMHDNGLLRRYMDPAALLRELGLRTGDLVFEVGCGPGFYTMGAAEATGSEGAIVSFDVNPYACRYVEEKLKKSSIGNVRVVNRNAADSGLEDDSVDFAFVVGVPHVVGGEHILLEELGRVLRPGGVLAYRPSRGNVKGLVEDAKAQGFKREKTKKRFLLFHKT